LSGSLAPGRFPRPSRRSLPLLAGTAVVAVLVGTTIATLRDNAPTKVTAAPVAAAAPVASLLPDRAEDRANRSQQRIAEVPEASPSVAPSSPAPVPASPSPKPKPSKTATQTAKPPADGGSVVGSGTCQASYYTDEGSRTASGEIFHVNDFTAAHKTLPFNTRVRVTNVSNGKSTVVRINDRGPFAAGRCLDLTTAAFTAIASQSAGVATVKYEVLG
jgi:rare lipoprotein A